MIFHSRPLGSPSSTQQPQPHLEGEGALTNISHSHHPASAGENEHREVFYMKAAAALQFVRLVKRSVSSTEEYEAFVHVMVDFMRRILGLAGPNQQDGWGYLLAEGGHLPTCGGALAKLPTDCSSSGFVNSLLNSQSRSPLRAAEAEDEDLVEPFSRNSSPSSPLCYLSDPGRFGSIVNSRFK